MASAFTHAFVGASLLEILKKGRKAVGFWILAVVCSVLPDVDVIGFQFGVPYGSILGHRGFTHSLTFAAILGLVVVEIFFSEERRFSGNWWIFFFSFFAITASHGLLDAMTDGGLGVAFFSPFENTRYFFPWRPVHVSPIGTDRFFNGGRALGILESEFIWIWIPTILLLMMNKLARSILRRAEVKE